MSKAQEFDCKIQFDDNPLKVYYGGQTLKGRADVIIRESKIVRGLLIVVLIYLQIAVSVILILVFFLFKIGIYVQIDGKGSCYWVVSSNRQRRSDLKFQNITVLTFILSDFSLTAIPSKYSVEV